MRIRPVRLCSHASFLSTSKQSISATQSLQFDRSTASTMAGKCHQITQCAAFGKFRDKILITLGSTGLETFTFDCERVCQEIKGITAAFAKHVSYVKKKSEKSQKGKRCKARCCEGQSTSTESETTCEDEFDGSQYELSESEKPRRILRSHVKSAKSKGPSQQGSYKGRRARRNERRKSSSKSESVSTDEANDGDDSDDENAPSTIVNVRKRSTRKLRVVISSDGDGDSEGDAPGYAKFSSKFAESDDESCQDEKKAKVSSPVSLEDEDDLSITITADKEHENLAGLENDSRNVNVGSFAGEFDCPFRIKTDLFEDDDEDTEDDNKTVKILKTHIQDKPAGSRQQKSREDLKTQENNSSPSSKDNANTRRHSLKGYKIPRIAQKCRTPSPESSKFFPQPKNPMGRGGYEPPSNHAARSTALTEDFRSKSTEKSFVVQNDRQRTPKNTQDNQQDITIQSSPASNPIVSMEGVTQIKCEQEVWILDSPNQVEVGSNVSLNDSGFSDHANIARRPTTTSRTPPSESLSSNVEQRDSFGTVTDFGAKSDIPSRPGSSRRARYNSNGPNYGVTATGIRYEIPPTSRQIDEPMPETRISDVECPDYGTHERFPSKSFQGNYRGRHFKGHRNSNRYARSANGYRKHKFDPLSQNKYRQRSRRQGYFRGYGYRHEVQCIQHTHHRQDDPAGEYSAIELDDITENSLSKSNCQNFVWVDGFGNSHDHGK